jgi:hypothetical protein
MATLGVNGNRPNTGASSLEVDDGGGLSTSFAYYSFAFPNPPLSMGAVSARFYANFGTIPTGHYTAFAEFVGSAGLAAGPQLVTDDNGMGELWKLWVGDGMEKFDTIDKPLKVDHWYCMELSVDFAANGGAGAVWFSVDGAGVAVQPGVPPKAIDSFAFGLVNSPGAGPSTVYLDDVVIAPGGPIGCK